MGFLTSKLLAWKNGSDSERQTTTKNESMPVSPVSPKTTMDSVIVEAAKQTFENESALDVANNAVMLNHLRQLAASEEETVARYREMKLFGATKEDVRKGNGTMHAPGPLIICDDYKPDLSQHPPTVIIPPQPRTNLLPWVIAAALAAGGAGVVGGKLLNGKAPGATETPSASTVIGVGKTVELIQPK